MLFKFTFPLHPFPTQLVEAENKKEALELFALARCPFKPAEGITEEGKQIEQEEFNSYFSMEKKVIEDDWTCEEVGGDDVLTRQSLKEGNLHLFDLLANYQE